MAEGRFVSKSISTDYELNCVVSLEADYLFEKCIPHLDRDGRMTGHPGEVKAKAVPLRAEMSVDVVNDCLGELAAAGLVLWYEVEGKPALWFKGFAPHNKGMRYEREATSRLPAPNHPKAQRLTTLLRESSVSSPAEVKGSEVKGSESKESLPAFPVSPREGQQQQRQAAAVENLIAYVGEYHRHDVLAVAAMPGTGSAWAHGLLATWGPRGSMEGDRVPAAMRAEVVGLALSRYATDRERWYGRGFKAFVDRAYTDMLEHQAAKAKADEAKAGAREREAEKVREAERIERMNEVARENARRHGELPDPNALVRSIATAKSLGGSTA